MQQHRDGKPVPYAWDELCAIQPNTQKPTPGRGYLPYNLFDG